MSATSPIDLRGTTKEIEDSYRGGSSRDGYKNTLVQEQATNLTTRLELSKNDFISACGELAIDRYGE
jgi:hypothetical protein